MQPNGESHSFHPCTLRLLLCCLSDLATGNVAPRTHAEREARLDHFFHEMDWKKNLKISRVESLWGFSSRTGSLSAGNNGRKVTGKERDASGMFAKSWEEKSSKYVSRLRRKKTWRFIRRLQKNGVFGSWPHPRRQSVHWPPTYKQTHSGQQIGPH